jgi:hypothetical protein
MKETMNPAFTNASFHLFHGGKRPAGELHAAFERLRAATEQLEGVDAPTGHGQMSYRIHVVQLQIAARALAVAEPHDRQLWFSQVSAVCNSCHEAFGD